MTTRKDHYIPQFILRRFRQDRRGKAYYAEKGKPGIRLKPVKEIFCEERGERILARPPKLKQEGEFATLASDPEWTEFAAETLMRLEDGWARAITGMIKWSEGLNQNPPIAAPGWIDVQRGPNEQEAWVREIADYCLRTMFRSEEVGHELWDRHREGEEHDLRELIKRELGIELQPSAELREIFQQHNRAQTRTGALADNRRLFERHNVQITIVLWRILDKTRFIIGSRGGCVVEHEGSKYSVFPIDPKVAISLQGRTETNRIFPSEIQAENPRTIIVHNIPGRIGITAELVNECMWRRCAAVVGLEREDVIRAINR